MLCPRQGANCCYIDNVKLLQDLIKNEDVCHSTQSVEIKVCYARNKGPIVVTLIM